jgi:hypothetical protein
VPLVGEIGHHRLRGQTVRGHPLVLNGSNVCGCQVKLCGDMAGRGTSHPDSGMGIPSAPSPKCFRASTAFEASGERS